MGFIAAEKMESIQANRPGGGYFQCKLIPDNDSLKVRFLGNAVTGVGGWQDGKPVRFPVKPTPEDFDMTTLDQEKDFKTGAVKGPGKLKDFVAAVLWNYKEESLQIFEITQASIQDKIFDLMRSEEWGDVTNYDVSIKKNVDNGRTSYEVLPSPKGMGKLDKTIEKAFDETFIDLTKLFSGEDPYKAA